MGWILSSMMDEIIDTMADEASPEMLQGFLLLTSRVMTWVATGDPEDIPEEFKDHAGILEISQPELEAAEVAH